MKKVSVLLLLVLALLPAVAATHKKKKAAAPAAAKSQANKKGAKAPGHAAGTKGRKAVSRKAAPRDATPSKAASTGRTLRGKSAGRQKGPAVSRAQMELAQSMAGEVYRMGQKLAPQQRVPLLLRLLYTMRPEVLAEEKQKWAEELFVTAWQLPQETVEDRAARNSAMATAAARMSIYDADRALAMLDNEPAGMGPDDEADARSMAARLVFAAFLRRHGAAGSRELAAHARRWSEHGGYPWAAMEAAMAHLRPDGAASAEFFQQELDAFHGGHDGLFGTSEFAGLVQQAVEMEAVPSAAAENAGSAVVEHLQRLTGGDAAQLTPKQKNLVAQTVAALRTVAPKANGVLQESMPSLVALRVVRTVPVDTAAIDPELEAAFQQLAAAMRQGRGEDLRTAIVNGVRLLNLRYPAKACAGCTAPDAQSAALVLLAAYAAPGSIGEQLKGIEDPYWRAYFLAIAAQQMGEPTRVADPARRAVEEEKEEAEPE
ncbi:MAG: hypothetical protein P4M01_06795 [Acidobacteriota bacterium]|nr:hypothetical protein [Acidobacteriota bacterium]